MQGNPAWAVGRPCSASPLLDNRHFAELREVVLRKCWKDLQGAGTSPMPFIDLLGFFWFKLSIQFFLCYFFPLFIFIFLSFSFSDD